MTWCMVATGLSSAAEKGDQEFNARVAVVLDYELSSTSWDADIKAADGFNETYRQHPPCPFQEVTCIDGHVKEVHFHLSHLVGTVPSELAQLSWLTILHPHTNEISGTLPTELGKLSPLMTSFNVYSNSISGTIPSQLGHLTSLDEVVLSKCRFSGTLPSELGRLSNLKGLYIHGNSLSGSLPTEIGQLSLLTIARIFGPHTRFSGSLPSQLYRFDDAKYWCAPPFDECLRCAPVPPIQVWEGVG